MQIWVDADACPNPIKEILFRAAARVKVGLTLVANRPIRIPPSPYIKAIRVGSGFDMADNWIAQQVAYGDLVITADVPLAAAVIERQGFALNPRGEFYSLENISERLTMRNFMEELRSTGVDIGGPPAFSQADRQAFANQLDRFLNVNGV
jgi:uncharacterized protein YaiI (UPF0178 family)